MYLSYVIVPNNPDYKCLFTLLYWSLECNLPQGRELCLLLYYIFSISRTYFLNKHFLIK